MPTQLQLFEQRKQITRVKGRTAEHILAFAEHVGGREWHVADLVAFVSKRVQVAPASCGR